MHSTVHVDDAVPAEHEHYHDINVTPKIHEGTAHPDWKTTVDGNVVHYDPDIIEDPVKAGHVEVHATVD